MHDMGDKGEQTLRAGLRKAVMYSKMNAVPLPNSQKASLVLFWGVLKLECNPIPLSTSSF